MATYLLTWNPKLWPWSDLPRAVAETAAGRAWSARWSTGNTTRIVEGDRLFLLRQGKEPRGIIAVGIAESEVFEEPHWDVRRARAGDTANYVRVRFDRVLDPSKAPPLAIEGNAALDGINSRPAASGFMVDETLAGVLDAEWNRHAAALTVGASMEANWLLPEELPGAKYVEGAVRTVEVNAYERDPAARLACLARWGRGCCVCGVVMSERYGSIAAGFIHVHHLKPLARAGGERTIDPAQDLRPVCPNCHAVIHLEDPPMTIEAARSLIKPK